MTSKTPTLVLLALLACGLFLTAPAARAAQVPEDTIADLIWPVETPKTPAERPTKPCDGIPLAQWQVGPGEAWQQLRVKAQKKLSERGAPAVKPLLDLIGRTKDNSVKILALTGLSMMDPSVLAPAAPALMALLNDENAGVVYLAAKTLGIMRHRPAAPVLQGLAASPEVVIRMIVADALGQIGDVRSAAVLITLLDDKDKGVRLHAIAALGELGAALEAVPQLFKKLESADVNEREAVIDALLALVGYDVRTEHPRWPIVPPDQRQVIIDAVKAWWKNALDKRVIQIDNNPELALRLSMAIDRDQKGSIRIRAIRAAEQIGARDAEAARRAVDELIVVLLDRDLAVRGAAAEAVSRLSKIKIEYRRGMSEQEWIIIVDEFRRRWNDIRIK